MKKILVIVAHPDDAELGMGMKIKSHTQNGDVVKIIVVTNGEYKDSPKGRILEAKKSAKILGVKELFFLGFSCGHLNEVSDQIRLEIEKIIKKEDPDMIYTIFSKDLHIDHEVVSRQAVTAARSITSLVMFSVANSHDFNPNFFFCGGEELFRFKIKALSCYKSEIKKRGTIDLVAMKALSKYEIQRYFHHSLVSRIRVNKKLNNKDNLYFEPFFVERLILD